jgi:hypothetical protein
MIYYRVLLIFLLTCVVANSEPTNSEPAGSRSANILSNLPPALQAVIASSGGALKVSTTPPPPEVPTNDNDSATIYTAWVVPPLKSLLMSLEPTAKISERTNGTTNGSSSSIICELPGVSLRFTVPKLWDAAAQRRAMKFWIAKVPGCDTNAPAVMSLMRQVDGTVGCIGVGVTPRYDPAGKASALVRGVAARLDGYVYSRYSFYAPSGEIIIGVPNAPAKL